MRMVLCIRCAQHMGSDRRVKRVGQNSKRDKCQCCGQKIWSSTYDVDAKPRLAGVGRPENDG